MNPLYFICFFFYIFDFAVAQPVDHNIQINESEYYKSFIHCTGNSKYFAKYAIEAHSTMLDFQDTIYCKLHIPPGLFNPDLMNQKEREEHQSEFNYSKDKTIPLILNFYANGVKVSSAKEYIKKPEKADDLFSIYFNLNLSADFSEYKEIKKAFTKLVHSLKKPFSSIVLEAIIPSKNPDSDRYKNVAWGSITIKADLSKLEEWKTNNSNH